MAIATTYKGYNVYWSDNEDAWRCHDLDITDQSLTRMRGKIDKVALSVRKKSSVRAVMVDEMGAVVDVTIIEYMGDDNARYGGGKDRVAIMAPDFGGGNRLVRRLVPLSKLSPDTAETAAKATVVRDMIARANELKAEAGKAHRSIPRMTLEGIAELVRLSGIKEVEA